MKTFLKSVAEDLIGRFGRNLSAVTIVFPGKRTQLFMNECLLQCAGGPIWAPRYTTIEDFFLRRSHYTPTETLRNVCELYNVYKQLRPDAESLDEFYGWGEIILHDFEDIDKHLVDANHLFLNAAQLSDLDRTDYLSDAQREALQRFFSEFADDQLSQLKERFRRTWELMPQLYSGLRQRLREQGLMYKAGIYREVVEGIDDIEESDTNTTYAFVGFNVLDEVEHALFKFFKQHCNTLFYWDYDIFYASPQSDNEAGLFLRENLLRYPNALTDEDLFDNLIHPDKEITYVATSTDNAQARALPLWLQQHTDVATSRRAVVLCDESLMKSVIHSIPSPEEAPDYAPQEMNVTMGFPLVDTPIHGYFMALLDLQTEGYDPRLRRFRPTAVQRLHDNAFCPADLTLEHPEDNTALLTWLRQQMETLGLGIKDYGLTELYQQLYTEATFQIYCTLNQFLQLVSDGVLTVERNTLRRLLRQALSSLSIPFHGEMNEGLQVMGLMETRNLDFEDIAVLSVGEGFMPRKADDTSLIPYTLRAAYGLNTEERQTAVFAYYFFRLLQRARSITLFYNDTPSTTAQHEISRYLLQLQAETSLPIRSIRLGGLTRTQQSELPNVEKTAEVMARLTERFDTNAGGTHRLSPSALGDYLTCPMRFYLKNVAGIHIPQRPEDGIDPRLFGTILHDTAQLVYEQMARRLDTWTFERRDYEPLLDPKTTLIEDCLTQVFRKEYFKNDKKAQFTGTSILIRDVILRYLRTLFRWDSLHAPITIMGLEKDVTGSLEIETAQGQRSIKTGGRIDRLDRINIGGREYLRIVDYKTGGFKTLPKNIEDIFNPQADGQHHYYLQTLLYALLLRKDADLPLRPALFYVTKAQQEREQYSPDLAFSENRKKTVIEEVTPDMFTAFEAHLQRLMAEIFDPQVPFACTDKHERCKLCDFKQLCHN